MQTNNNSNNNNNSISNSNQLQKSTVSDLKKSNSNSNLFILWVHDQAFSKEELVVNPEHFPKLKVGDIVEISNTNNTTKKLCLRVKTLAPVKGPLQISIAKYIASVFEFVNRREVIVNIVPEKSVQIDFIELSFKDQYIGRSDMWRLKLSLQNECLYVLKKLSFAQIRAQVEEIVAGGQKISSGLIDENTKFVFRSRSARFVLFIQMSKEMWDYSPQDGELYFEKAVNGFLASLFSRWKTLSVNHTITIILFSRTFHDSTEILNEVPNIPRNSQGKLYQDFYKVVVSEETRPDWSSIIVTLKKEFNNYHTSVNWDIYGRNSALGQNSTASQGNFLEAINLGMSYFDKHFIDRDFTRTGQMIVVVSAGTGIFEVDQDINLITKQRMIDNGIGCDLICLNKHPLHIVPLFKYNDKNIDQKDQYNVPYWLAISFYDDSVTTTTNKDKDNNKDTNKDQNESNLPLCSSPSMIISNNIISSIYFQNEEKEGFIPQFRIPEKHISYYSYENDNDDRDTRYNFYTPKDPRKFPGFSSKSNHKYTSHSLGVNSYEDTIFNLPMPESPSGESNQYSMESSIVEDYLPSDTDQSDFSDTEDNIPSTPPSTTNSIPFKKKSHTTPNLISNQHSNLTKQYSSYERKTTVHRYIPSANKQHNQHLNSHIQHSPTSHHSFESKRFDLLQGTTSTHPNVSIVKPKAHINPFTYDSTPFHLSGNRRRWSHLWFSPNTYIFGKTNATANPFLPNWKSLCEPASLPITTDYFPSPKDLKSKYLGYLHQLTPDNIEAMLKELISQRLAQGYQLIMQTVAEQMTNKPASTLNTAATLIAPFRANKKTSYQLSLGHDFHLITYEPSLQNIQVQRFVRQYRNQTKSIKYHYYLCAMHQNTFTYQAQNIVHQLASHYNWNNVDNIISGLSSDDIGQTNESIFLPNIKYWRIQYAILPINQAVPNTTGVSTSNPNIGNSTTISHDIIEEEENTNVPVQINSTSVTNISITSPSNSTNSSATTGTTLSTSPNSNPLHPHLNSISAPTSPIASTKHQSNSNRVITGSGNITNTNNNSGITIVNNFKSPPTVSSSIGINTTQIPPIGLTGSSLINNSSNSMHFTSTSATPVTTSSDNSILPEHNEEDRIAAFIKFKEYLNSQIIRNNTSSKAPKKIDAKTCFSASIEEPSNNSNGSLQFSNSFNGGNHFDGSNQPPQSNSITIGGSRGQLSSSAGLSEPNIIDSNKLQPNNLDAIFYKMNLPLPTGIRTFPKKVFFKTYKKCVVATEVITWLLNNVDISNRADAKNLGTLMMSKKYIMEVERDTFNDNFGVYRLKDDNDINPSSNNNPNNQSSTFKKSDSSQNFNTNSNNGTAANSLQSSMVNSPIKTVNSPDQSPISSPKYNRSTSALGTSIRTSDSVLFSNDTMSNMNNNSNDNIPSPTNSYHSTYSENKTSTPIPTTPFGGHSFLSNSQSTFLNPPNYIENYVNPNNTEEVKIEMDSTKTDRNEWITMVYDKTFCPTKFFHMEFRWMVSTGCVVDDFINTCARKAKQFGLSLVQIPMEKNYSPFYSPVHIKMDSQLMNHVNLKQILANANLIPDFIQKRQSSLIKRNDIYAFNFDQDIPFTEFVHKSGLLIVRVLDDGFLCYTNNAPSNRANLSNALACLDSFQKYCDQLNRTMVPSLIYPSPEDSDLLLRAQFLNDSSPQSNILSLLPLQEANFISLFAQGYTSDNSKLKSNNNNNNNNNNNDNNNNNIMTEEEERVFREILANNNKGEMNSEFLYYSSLSESPVDTHNPNESDYKF